MSQLKKALSKNNIHQRITASLKLPEYNQVGSFIPERDSYSVYKLEGNSSISNSYEYTLIFVSNEAIKVEDIVDTSAELSLRDESRSFGSKKIFGKIIKAEEIGSIARKKLYQVKIVSPLHYLSLNKRYEIYQDKNVPQIVQEIISRYSVLLNLKLNIKVDTQTLPKRHYCTQYEQSDFEFIKMLCEEEGFVLLLESTKSDTYDISLCELNEHVPLAPESIECHYNFQKEFSASAQVQDYYESQKPSLDFSVQAGATVHSSTFADNEHSSQLRSDIKQYKLRDRLDKLDESKHKDLARYTKIDAEAAYANGISITGESSDIMLNDGLSVRLEDKKVHKQVEAIILSAKYKATFPNALDEYVEEGLHESEEQYSVSFIAIPKDITYKPQKSISKVRINSIQTAIVSGGKQETQEKANEIDVNELGEIRVIFHFDEKRPTSCYIPLSTIYSGDGYGAQFLPRVNSEVIVSFINGDIDRPLITGALHNGENRHPYNLPKEKTKSFIKTQTTPQYEDKEGYNELLFEDKQGEELLSLRAQKDYKLKVLHDSHTHIENSSKTVIDNDAELTVASNLSQTVGEDKTVNVQGNSVTIIEKEQITTVKEDNELHVMQNNTNIISKNQMSIVEKKLIERIKGEATYYIEKDQKEKYLQNLYLQVGQKMGLDITGAYHLNASSIKQKAKTIELEATDGISLKCGGNVLTVDASGIHLKAAVVDTASSNPGVTAAPVNVPKIEKPVYNKLRVTGITASISKQNEITELLTYTATVEKYENDAWSATTELTPTQEAQLQWSFIKNNDQNDKDIISDNPTDDEIVINGLEMSVKLEAKNIYKFGHAHAFVVDADDENGYAVSELKRFIEVEDILTEIIDNDTKEFEAQAIYNVDEITEEEINMTRWIVDENETDGKDRLKHSYEGEKLDVIIKAYIESTQTDAAIAHVNFAYSEEEINGEKEADE